MALEHARRSLRRHLLLCLYVTNGAILIGGEMNSEIEKNAVSRS